MKTIPDNVLDEMIAITKAIRKPPGSIKRANAERRAVRLLKKLLKLKELRLAGRIERGRTINQ